MSVIGKKGVVLFLAMWAGGILLHAQENAQKPLSLESAVIAALHNNSTLKVSSYEAKVAKAKHGQTNAVFLPHIEASYMAMTTNNPLNVFGTKLQQASVTAADFNPVLLNDPDHAEDYSAKLEVQQPLINVDMMYQRAAAKKQKEMYEYKYQRTQEYVKFDVQKAYLNLQLAYKSVDVLQESLENARRIETNALNYFNQGLIKKSDLLNVQVNVATVESQLSKAKSMVSSASEALALAMGEQAGAVYLTDSLTKQDALIATELPEVSVTRADLMAMQKAMEATKMMENSEKMNLLPRINAFASYQYNDPDFATFEQDSYLAGVKLSWTLFNGTRTYNAISTQKAERKKMEVQYQLQKDQSQLELNKAYRDQLDFQAEVKRQNISVAQAEESMRILQDRYNEGLVSTSDLLMAQSQLLQQKMLLAQAIYGNNLTIAYLNFLGTK